ncbi:right-handed parallel beta-helix repeat-containing protein [Thiobacillus sp.]|uniref:right-handed parallel beta-helix repeat-containing protein n=1 Tax=Thiobacillus sp. TaxID=924 RepID=UPI0025DAE55F|nr:right-handed parallel beta-helix repeat-containing protein [Thiobacillus sp.]MBT9538268.1 right-handed parallel beta-helix repeat-containing protein [Thiobacillus sp.]
MQYSSKRMGQGTLCVALFAFSTTVSWATDYYVDATQGNDVFTGKLAAPSGSNGPFKTLTRLVAQLQAGDRGLLKCGEVWREPLMLTAAGTAASPIHVLSYGSCTGNNKPELRLSKPLSLSSVNTQWVGTHTQPIAMAFVNGQSKSMARYPASDALLTGYVSSSARFDLPDAIKSFTKSQLAGSVLTARVNPHDAEERSLTDVPLVGVAQLDKSFKYLPAPGVAYYLEGKSWMMAKAGDWAWGNDARTQLVMHGGTTGTVEVSGEINGITLASAHYTSISDLKITNAGGQGVSVAGSKYVSLNNLEIRNVRSAFVRVANSPNITISGVNADTTQYDGVYVTQSPSAVIRGNDLRNIGTQPNPKKSIAAIALLDSPQATVELNYIENAAYVGIMFDVGSLVANNVVLSACQVLEDCGYIYTSGINKGGAYFSAKVTDNLLSDKGGTIAGTRQKLVAGIYLDDFAAGIGVIGNYVEGTERGIYLHNTRDTWIHLNTVFDAKVRNLMLSERGALSSSVTINNIVFDNTLVAPTNIPSILLDSSLGIEGIADISGNNFAATEYGPTQENWFGSLITRVLPDLSSTHWSKDTLLVANQSACNTSSLYWTSAITKVDPANRSLWKLWSTQSDARRLTDGPLHVQAGTTGETIVSSPLFAEQAGKDHVLSLSGNFSGGQTRVPVVLRQSAYPYTNRAAVLYVYPDALGNFNVCTVFKPHTSESSARLDIHLKPTDDIKINFVGFKEATYQPPTKRFASLINPGDESANLGCPFADTQSCAGARLLDQSPAVWPMYMPPRSGQVVYIP